MDTKHSILTALALTLPLAGALAQTTNKVAVTTGMLSASSVYNGYTPITAFDGDMSQNSGWCPVGGVREAWLAVDFGMPRQIAYVQVFPDRYIAGNTAYSYLDRFRVEVWSNATWQAVAPLISTLQEQWYVAEINLPVTKLRFWCESDGNGPQVKEIEIYEVVMPPRLSIARSNDVLTVSWPLAGAEGWVLEATNALP
ncbi:MAG: discoidin domain-containing protein, partial [Verrucomicrobiia bacterium]